MFLVEKLNFHPSDRLEERLFFLQNRRLFEEALTFLEINYTSLAFHWIYYLGFYRGWRAVRCQVL